MKEMYKEILGIAITKILVGGMEENWEGTLGVCGYMDVLPAFLVNNA